MPKSDRLKLISSSQSRGKTSGLPSKPIVSKGKPKKPAEKQEEGTTSQLRMSLEVLYDASTLPIFGLSLNELLENIFQKIGARLDLSMLAIWLLDEKKEFFDLAASYNFPEAFLVLVEKSKLKSTEGGPGIVFKTKKPYLLKSLLTDPQAAQRFVQVAREKAIPIKSIFILPLMIEEEMFGTINFFFKDFRESVSKTELIIFSAIANQVAAFVQNSKVYKELREKMRDLEGSGRALINILEDIDEARRVTEEEKNKISTIIFNFVDGLLVFDKENKLSLVNPYAEEIFDIKERDLIGREISELGTFPTFKSLIALLGGELKGIFRKELTLKESLALEVSMVPMMKGEDRLGTLIILHDITREKMIERMKTEFVSISAHQLRTPLSAIKWTLRMLLDGDLGEITLEQRDFIEKTYQSNERMIALINDLLDVTRIEEGRYLYKTQLSRIDDIVQAVIDSYREEIEKKKVKLEFRKLEKKLPKAEVDVEKIRLAVQNLLDNAVRYTSPGGEITISLKYDKKEIELQIQDTGIGIPKDQQDRVFTKFFRAANVMRIEAEGSGLGLFITKNIIEAHGGKIWFESEVGEGTTFHFTLPAKEEFAKFLERF